jgi:asparagine synthase (glutamine-hydrolysing)
MPFITGIIWKDKTIARDSAYRLTELIEKKGVAQASVTYSWGIVIAGKETQEPESERVEILENNTGILIGRLFEKSNNISTKLREEDVVAIKKSGQNLSKNYWGRYILALCDELEQTIAVFREPQGGISLFIYYFDKGVIFSSELTYIYDFFEDKLELDWTYLTSFVVSAHTMTNRTPFIGVTELLPACSITLSAHTKAEPILFWDPTKIKPYLAKNIEDDLIEKLVQSTKAWIQDTSGTIGIDLSGGLDSSSILMVLKNIAQERQIIAFNAYHPDVASSDERVHAKKVADVCGVELVYRDLSKHIYWDSLSTIRTNKPTGCLTVNSHLNELEAQFQKYGIIELFSGQGGDHLFISSPSAEILVDYMLEKGLKGITKKITDLSILYRQPLIQVIKETCLNVLYYSLGRVKKDLVFNYQPWMKADTFYPKVQKEIFQVPFWENLKNVYPGKANHISAIYEATLYSDQGEIVKHLKTINPLLSQPLVEFACAISTYSFLDNGYDRIIFRKAMYDYTKNEYVWRRHKGEATGIFILNVQANFDLIGELILEGAFARENLINKDLLYAELKSLKHGKTNDNPWPIIQLLNVEAWLRAWQK